MWGRRLRRWLENQEAEEVEEAQEVEQEVKTFCAFQRLRTIWASGIRPDEKNHRIQADTFQCAMACKLQ